MNSIYDKFKKVNIDWLCDKAIKTLIFDNFTGIFFDKIHDDFFVGDFQTIIKHKGDDNVITLASYCITDFFGSGFVDLKFWQKNKEIEKIYPALKSTMYCDCLDFLKNEANYANAA
jgi:hypothetical protein